MKKLLSILLTLAMLLPAAAIAEDEEIKVLLDGVQIQFDLQPVIENERTLVPMRAIFEAMGADVEWHESTRNIKAYKRSEKALIDLQILINSNVMKRTRFSLTGGPGGAGVPVEQIELDAPAKIISDLAFVPLRAISEAFDCKVDWNGETRTVNITSDKTATPAPVDNYTDKLMSKLPQDENYVVSPFSLKMAMMMATNGAEGETQKEILDAFDVTDINEFNTAAKKLISDLNADDKAEVNIANSLWFNKDVGGEEGDFSDTFKNIIKNNYFGTAEAVTNKNSIEKVNEWTEQQTNGKIKNLLSEDKREYLAALVNAIYMKAQWQNKFTKEATYKESFTDIDGKANEIDFMHQTAHFDYFENEDTKMVKLPYTNGMSMYVVLGDTKNFGNHIEYLTLKNVHLSLPKVKIDYSVGFDDILKTMGVEKAFSDFAEFKPMVQNTTDIKIDTVIQKAMIDVDEEGTEAAAATAVVMVEATSMREPEEIVEFKADKPFTYYILDDTSGEVLFAGRYVKSN